MLVYNRLIEVNLVDLKRICQTCIFLWPHWPIDNPLKGSYPITLLSLSLTGKQKLPVWCDNGDAVVPVVTLCGWRQARQHSVAVLLTANEDLAKSIRILGEKEE